MVGAAARSPENRFGRTRQNGSHGCRLCRHSPSHPDVSRVFRAYTVRGDRRTCESFAYLIQHLPHDPRRPSRRNRAFAADRKRRRRALCARRTAADPCHAAGQHRLAGARPARRQAVGRGLALEPRRGLRADEVPGRHGLARPALGAGPLARARPRRGADRSHCPRGARARPRYALSVDLSRRAVERAVLRAARLLARCRAAHGRRPSAGSS